MTGAGSQDIGDWGTDQLRAALAGRGFVVNEFARDVGEDLLVELGGRAVAVVGSPPPRQAYIQVKAHADNADEDTYTERIERKHLQRWAFQRLPVFVVVVNGFPRAPTFYLRSIDDYLRETPEALDPARNQQTFAVRTVVAPTLSDALEVQIEHFYRTAVPNLADLDQVDLANNHLEFVGEREDLYPHALVRIDSWKCVYKSEPRPGNLRGAVDFIAARACDRVGNGERPAQVVCFLYRSQAAMNSNQWVARVVWSEKRHGSAPGSWIDKPEVAVATRTEVAEVQRYVAERTATEVEFSAFLRPLARRADRLAQKILNAPPAAPWTADDVVQLRSLEAEWETGAYAPPRLHHVGEFFGAFLDTLERHRWTVQDSFEATPTTRARWRQQEFAKLAGFHAAILLLLDQATSK